MNLITMFAIAVGGTVLYKWWEYKRWKIRRKEIESTLMRMLVEGKKPDEIAKHFTGDKE